MLNFYKNKHIVKFFSIKTPDMKKYNGIKQTYMYLYLKSYKQLKKSTEKALDKLKAGYAEKTFKS